MFGKKQVDLITDTVETVIGPSVKVEGDFIGEGDVIIEGSVVGNLQTNHNLRIGPQAEVKAEVKAANAYIAGSVSGSLTISDALEIAATAQIKGDISCTTISIEAGALINGKLSMQGQQVSNGSKNKKILIATDEEVGDQEEL